uniref:J domain-containing protein n=1 Tax=Oryza sativa subsp. japonica TaxID=39947 RepID=Q9FWH6_ORYSJ|nr:unknown protein [Oryza sativa Japonica Group]
MSTAAPASATAAASLFLRRSLSSSSPRHVFLPHWVAPIVVARPARLSAVPAKRGGGGVVAAASAAAGSAQFGAGDSENPYEILGISPLDGFDQVKMAYKRRRKDAESNKDAEHLFKLERAYDMVMMEQLQNRKNGVAYGSIQVSKDIKYADNQPVVPWGPSLPNFLSWASHFVYGEKEYGEVEGRGIHMAKRVLRSLGLVLGSILAVSLGYTGLANFSQFLGQYIPSVVYNFQELIVTTASSVLLCILASYYR